jgi:hypothetical protein
MAVQGGGIAGNPMIRFEFAKSEFRKRLLAARAMEVPSL